MKKFHYTLLLLSAIIMVACGGESDNAQDANNKISPVQTSADDRTIYGLASDGCNDSVVFLLPADLGDPVKFNVISAYRKNKVHGKLKIGDRIAIVANKKDSTVADIVINLEQLQDTWCYTVMPSMKVPEGTTPAEQKELFESISDSIKEAYFVPREYGFTLKSHNVASPIGQVRESNILEDDSPVEYEYFPQYTEWHILNGQLILSRLATADPEAIEETIMADSTTTMASDTTEIILMQADSLILQFKHKRQSFYRVKNAGDANKLAKIKAEQNAREATKSLSNEDIPAKDIVKKTDSEK